ncbi:MAG: hypothetical protein CMO80_07315 [Verrucomicrobiales bacterium]|nr:hypothetical protein [Verrucomicrobiales bacterium]|tara:strand:- start:101 stop:370 length:270 start_codon:yes stop_codon:yes gene_type:complete
MERRATLGIVSTSGLQGDAGQRPALQFSNRLCYSIAEGKSGQITELAEVFPNDSMWKVIFPSPSQERYAGASGGRFKIDQDPGYEQAAS